MHCHLTAFLGICLSGSAAAAQTPCLNLAPPAGKAPVLQGRVIDKSTSKPLATVFILVDRAPVGMTNCDGEYDVMPFPDGRHEIVVDHRGYISQVHTVTFSSETVARLDIALVPAAPPCCTLRGSWRIDLHMDSASTMMDPPTARDVQGSLVFADSLGLDMERPSLPDSHFHEINGRFDITLTPFFGGSGGPEGGRAITGPTDGDFFREATGSVFAGDSVAIELVPGLSHGGLALEGRISGDTIRGTWEQRAYCCGARGGFTMHRVGP